MPSVEIRLYMPHISFLDRLCFQMDENGEFWNEDTRKNFLSLRSVHLCEEESHRLPRGKCSFCHDCRISLKFLKQAAVSLSDLQTLSCKAIYYLLLRGFVQSYLLGELQK